MIITILSLAMALDHLANLAKKVSTAKTIVIHMTVREEPQFPKFVGKKLVFSIDRTKNRYCVKSTDGFYAASSDGKELFGKVDGRKFNQTVEKGMSPFMAVPGFEAFLDAKNSKFKVEKGKNPQEVTLTLPVGTITKTVKFVFAKDGTLVGYSNTNGSVLSDRFSIDSVKFDVPVSEADLKMPD